MKIAGGEFHIFAMATFRAIPNTGSPCLVSYNSHIYIISEDDLRFSQYFKMLVHLIEFFLTIKNIPVPLAINKNDSERSHRTKRTEIHTSS